MRRRSVLRDARRRGARPHAKPRTSVTRPREADRDGGPEKALMLLIHWHHEDVGSWTDATVESLVVDSSGHPWKNIDLSCLRSTQVGFRSESIHGCVCCGQWLQLELES